MSLMGALLISLPWLCHYSQHNALWKKCNIWLQGFAPFILVLISDNFYLEMKCQMKERVKSTKQNALWIFQQQLQLLQLTSFIFWLCCSSKGYIQLASPRALHNIQIIKAVCVVIDANSVSAVTSITCDYYKSVLNWRHCFLEWCNMVLAGW